MERKLPWNTNASPVSHYEDGINNIGTPYINIYSQDGHMHPVELYYHQSNEGPVLTIPRSAYHLVVGNFMPTVYWTDAQTAALNDGNTHGYQVPHCLAQAYQTGKASIAEPGSARARNESFNGNLQPTPPLQVREQGQPLYPQPHAHIQAPHHAFPQHRPGSGAFVSTSERNKLGTTSLSAPGLRGNPHSANPPAIRREHKLDSAYNAARFGGDDHAIDLSQPHSSFAYNPSQSSPLGSISSAGDPLHVPLGPESLKSVKAHRAAMAQDLGYISKSSPIEGNHIDGHLHATIRQLYRNHAPSPVREADNSRPKPNSLLAEGYGYRDLQDELQQLHHDCLPHGLALQEAGARKQSKAPQSVAASLNNTKKPRGRRNGPMTQDQKDHARDVRRRPRVDCKHKRSKQKVTAEKEEYLSLLTPADLVLKCTCGDSAGQPTTPGDATQPASTLPQPRPFLDEPAYGSPNTHASFHSSFFTGPNTDTHSTPSRNPSFVSYESLSTPADMTMLTTMFQDTHGSYSNEHPRDRAVNDTTYVDAFGDTEDEAI